MKRSEALVRLLAVCSVIAPAILIASLLFSRALPWGLDGGDWLKRVNALLGNTYPMWEQTTFQYPPLFIVLVAAASGVGEVLSLEVWALVAYCLIPATTYFFVRGLFKDSTTGLAAAWLAAFTPLWFWMLGWGGYPDLLGLALLPTAFFFIVRYARERSRVNLALVVVGSAVIPVAHHLTFLVFLGVLVFWGALSAGFDRTTLRPISVSAAAGLLAFAGYRLAAGPWQFIISGAAALHYLQVGTQIPQIMFESAPLFAVLYFSAFASAILLAIDRRFRTPALLLAAWTVVPILGTQGYQLGVSLDYYRILYFFPQPFMILAAVPFVYRKEAVEFLKGGRLRENVHGVARFLREGRPGPGSATAKQMLALMVLVLSVIAVFATPVVGTGALYSMNSYRNAVNPYGDAEQVQVTNFLASHTPTNAVVVAEMPMGRWIEGLAQRRVLLQEDPRFLFLTGELQREEAAYAILYSYMGIRNGYAWVLDQAPYGQLSPAISVYSGGEYAGMVALNATDSYVSWQNAPTGQRQTLSLANSDSTNSTWNARNDQSASIETTYSVGPLEVYSIVSLYATERKVGLQFSVNSSEPGIVPTGLTISLDRWQNRTFYSTRTLANGTMDVMTDAGGLLIASSSGSGFPFEFAPSTPGHGVSGWINLWGDGAGNATGLFSYDRSQIVQEYGITDVVVPALQCGCTYPVAPPAYESLLRDPEFKVVYFNDRAVVLGAAGA